MSRQDFAKCFLLLSLLIAPAPGRAGEGPAKLILMAGKPSHPPRMHEFNAGVQLLADCLRPDERLDVHFVLNGWPQDERIFDGAAAIVFYMDGGSHHEIVQQGQRRLQMVDAWARQGVGLGFIHYAVDVVPNQAGDEFKRWMGGHFEHMFSCNPIWEPVFNDLPQHPITRGVGPFSIQDEWYFNMRFAHDISGNQPVNLDGMKFTPILVAAPDDTVRDGPYVYPKGPYPHIQAAKGRAEAMMWAVERPDGGRSFGFTGGHFHDNWGNAPFRKVILNAIVWLAKVDVPADGIESTVMPAQLDKHLDPK